MKKKKNWQETKPAYTHSCTAMPRLPYDAKNNKYAATGRKIFNNFCSTKEANISCASSYYTLTVWPVYQYRELQNGFCTILGLRKWSTLEP